IPTTWARSNARARSRRCRSQPLIAPPSWAARPWPCSAARAPARARRPPGRCRMSIATSEGLAPAASAASDDDSDAERVRVGELAASIMDALGAAGLPADDAAKVAELMVATDLAGADAHGVFRLPHYVRRLRAGGVNPRPRISVTRSAPATALVDGDDA